MASSSFNLDTDISVLTINRSVTFTNNQWVQGHIETSVDYPTGEVISVYATTGFVHVDMVVAGIRNSNGKVIIGYMAYTSRGNVTLNTDFIITTKKN